MNNSKIRNNKDIQKVERDMEGIAIVFMIVSFILIATGVAILLIAIMIESVQLIAEFSTHLEEY